jgi:hypothetical protein
VAGRDEKERIVMLRLLVIAGAAALAMPALAAAQPGCVPQSAGGTAATTVPCGGYYDSEGVWRQGGGHYDADGDWHAASGHFDHDGGWVASPAVDANAGAPAATSFGVDTAYVGGGSLAEREGRIAGLIRQGEGSGALRGLDANADLARLRQVRSLEARFSARHGGLTDQDRADLGARLDDLGAAVAAQWRPAR